MNFFFVNRQLELAAGYLSAGRLPSAKECFLRVIEAIDRAIASAEPRAAPVVSEASAGRCSPKAIA